jgi:hypothetical protein
MPEDFLIPCQFVGNRLLPQLSNSLCKVQVSRNLDAASILAFDTNFFRLSKRAIGSETMASSAHLTQKSHTWALLCCRRSAANAKDDHTGVPLEGVPGNISAQPLSAILRNLYTPSKGTIAFTIETTKSSR